MVQRHLLALALTLSACSGPQARAKKTVAELLAAGDPAAASRLIESRRNEYGPSNAALYDLDLGLALHYAGSYRESSRHFEAAEARLEELYTKSVSAAGGRLIANENISDFRGRPLDRVLGQFFDALNYTFLGEPDEALVAVRRMEAYLDELGRTESGQEPYPDDGMARYLAALLYSDSGRPDDARISFEAAQRAYARYKPLYGLEAPTLAPPSVPEEMGELVLIHYNGPAPRKVAVSALAGEDARPAKEPADSAGAAAGTLRATGHAVGSIARAASGATRAVVGTVLNTSYPRYVQDVSRVASSELETSEGKVATEAFTDVFSIVSRDLNEDVVRLKARSIMRATLKLAQQAATGVNASGSEFADLRSWSTVPAQIRMARSPLKSGSHRVLVRRLDAAGRVVSTRVFENVQIRSGRRTWLIDQTAA
jgi:tetratricopeptide (TPR) repeat protein